MKHSIKVHFCEDYFTYYRTITIEASSLEDFERQLDIWTEEIEKEAYEELVEIAGIKYDLPREWRIN